MLFDIYIIYILTFFKYKEIRSINIFLPMDIFYLNPWQMQCIFHFPSGETQIYRTEKDLHTFLHHFLSLFDVVSIFLLEFTHILHKMSAAVQKNTSTMPAVILY